ncbi:MAG: hypothetical protein OXT09_37640 [Myxococcales bacterium]|nr:hypothetical protein [Myxococcales bacterium]
MENDLDKIRSKLMGLAGTQLDDAAVAKLLAELLADGGGVLIELDSMTFKLLRRDGKFVLVRDPRKAHSTVPPRR